jgi:hypothetical protein
MADALSGAEKTPDCSALVTSSSFCRLGSALILSAAYSRARVRLKPPKMLYLRRVKIGADNHDLMPLVFLELNNDVLCILIEMQIYLLQPTPG